MIIVGVARQSFAVNALHHGLVYISIFSHTRTLASRNVVVTIEYDPWTRLRGTQIRAFYLVPLCRVSCRVVLALVVHHPHPSRVVVSVALDGEMRHGGFALLMWFECQLSPLLCVESKCRIVDDNNTSFI